MMNEKILAMFDEMDIFQTAAIVEKMGNLNSVWVGKRQEARKAISELGKRYGFTVEDAKAYMNR